MKVSIFINEFMNNKNAEEDHELNKIMKWNVIIYENEWRLMNQQF